MGNWNYRYQNMEFRSIFFISIFSTYWRHWNITINQAAIFIYLVFTCVVYISYWTCAINLDSCIIFAFSTLEYFHLFPFSAHFHSFLLLMFFFLFFYCSVKKNHHCWNGHGQIEYPFKKENILLKFLFWISKNEKKKIVWTNRCALNFIWTHSHMILLTCVFSCVTRNFLIPLNSALNINSYLARSKNDDRYYFSTLSQYVPNAHVVGT